MSHATKHSIYNTAVSVKDNAKKSKYITLSDVTVSNAIKGEKGALQTLCEKIARDVLFRATFICGNQTDAEDISQEALIRVCTNIHKLRNPIYFRRWLSRIVLNEARRHFEKNSKQKLMLCIDDYSEYIAEDRQNVLPHENAETNEQKDVVMEIISILPIRQREAILLHYYDEMNVTEVARLMGTSKANVSQCLNHARKNLKKELEKKDSTLIQSGATLSFAALSLDNLIVSTLSNEAASFLPDNPSWLFEVFNVLNEYLVFGAATVTTAATTAATTTATSNGVTSLSTKGVITSAATPSKISVGMITCLIASAVTALSIGLNMLINTSSIYNQEKSDIKGNIDFSGGYDFGENIVYVNPTDAKMLAVDDTGKIAIPLYWWITTSGDIESKYSGLIDELGGALSTLCETGPEDLYILHLRVETKSGETFVIGRNFYIVPENPDKGSQN